MVAATIAKYDAIGLPGQSTTSGSASWAGNLKLTPSDLMKVGQLYLDNRRSERRQLVPRQWVRDATAAQVITSGPYDSGGRGRLLTGRPKAAGILPGPGLDSDVTKAAQQQIVPGAPAGRPAP